MLKNAQEKMIKLS